MSLSLKKLLPEASSQDSIKHFQARVPLSLWEKADYVRNQHGWKWEDVANALLKKFIHEFEEKA